MLYCLQASRGVNVSAGESNLTSCPLSLSLWGSAAIFNVDDSVVDLETLAALYENVSIKHLQSQSFRIFVS